MSEAPEFATSLANMQEPPSYLERGSAAYKQQVINSRAVWRM